MTKRRHKPKAKPEPLFSGYSLAAAQQSSAADLSRVAAAQAAARVDAGALPGAAPRGTPAPNPKRGPRPVAPRGAATALRIAELLALPARLLPALPAAWTMLCEVCLDGQGQVVPLVVTTCAADYTTAQARHHVTLHGAEFAALALGAELDRVTPSEVERWVERKQRDRSWELTPHVTLGTYVARADQRLLSVGQVLRACGASIVNVASAAPAPPHFWEVSP